MTIQEQDLGLITRKVKQMAKQRLYRSNEFELTLAEDKFYTNNV